MEVKVFHGYEDFGLEKFENTDEWYYSIYPTWMSNVEMEEACRDGKGYTAGSRLGFFHAGTGEIHEPIKREQNVYLENPIYDRASNSFGILRYDFNKGILQVIAYKPDDESVEVIEQIFLWEIGDLMNVRLIESPFMIVRNSMEENAIEFLSPKRKIYLEENESVEFVEDGKMYGSKWYEDSMDDVLDYGYGEEVIVRDLETGKILERHKGYLNRMPDGTVWLMTE